MTAVAFAPDSTSVAVANAANEVVLFDVATLQHTRWSGKSAARLPARLLNMPGRVMHISFCPDPAVRVHQRASTVSLYHAVSVDQRCQARPLLPIGRISPVCWLT